MSEAWVESVVDTWALETARSFSERDLHDPELDDALQGAAAAIRQVLEVTSASRGVTPETDDYTSQSG